MQNSDSLLKTGLNNSENAQSTEPRAGVSRASDSHLAPHSDQLVIGAGQSDLNPKQDFYTTSHRRSFTHFEEAHCSIGADTTAMTTAETFQQKLG